eukprot:1109097_1
MGASESSITATASLQLTIIATERTESQFHIDFKTLNDGDTSLLCHGFIRCNTSISLDAVTPLIIKYFGMNHKPRQQQCSINVSDVTLYKNHFHSLLFLNVLDVDNQQCSKYNFRITLKQNKCTNWYYQHNGYGLQIGLFGLNASHLSIDKFWESWKDFDTVQDAVYTTRNIGGVYNLNGCAFRDRFKSTLDSDVIYISLRSQKQGRHIKHKNIITNAYIMMETHQVHAINVCMINIDSIINTVCGLRKKIPFQYELIMRIKMGPKHCHFIKTQAKYVKMLH